MARFLHNHNKITTKIWSNHCSELTEIELNGTELRKPHPSRLVGGAQMQNELVPQPHVVDKHSGGVSREQGVPDPYQAHQPRVPVPGR